MLQDVIIQQFSVFIEKIETQSPPFQLTTDDTDIVGPLLSLILFEVSYRTLPLHIDSRPFTGIVMDNDKLFLLPGRILIYEITMHHRISVRVAFLKHRQTGCPIVESSIRVGISKTTIHITVCAAMGYGFRRQGIVIIIHVHIAEHEIVARRTKGNECRRNRYVFYCFIHSIISLSLLLLFVRFVSIDIVSPTLPRGINLHP